ncbi:MAG TPA: 3D domain-containing protein [Bryobacteraceae bacterium]|jgi:3D (Asp-Asp-Asp) domain-containing protein
MRKLVYVGVLCVLLKIGAEASRYLPFEATAYCQSGITKSGTLTHSGIVAADPRVLPLGTRIRVENAGKYSGEYVVKDTGSKVIGRHIDLYIPHRRLAILFGRKKVLVSVVRWGSRTSSSGASS